jgi:glucokinase
MTLGNGALAIGIDVGGTKTLAELVDLSTGDVVASHRVPTGAADGGKAALDRCVALARQLCADARSGTARPPIGIALCEMVDGNGTPTSAATVDWLGLDVAAAFAALGPPRVTVESDVRAAAIAESRFGAGSAVDQFVYVGVGTGIAFTLMLDGVPHRGAHGNAILLGIPPVERVASGPAIAARAGASTAEAAFDDPAAAGVIADAARQLGVAMAWLSNALDPQLLVVGGGLGLRPDFLDAAVRAMNDSILEAGGHAVEVRPASLGERSAAIGAAIVASQRSGGYLPHQERD